MKRALNPHISVDCVIFGFDSNKLKVLLINRDLMDSVTKKSNKLKLPGDLIIKREILNESAKRILKEYTGLENIYLKQFGVFDEPDRLRPEDDLNWLRDTSGLTDIDRVVTIAYYSLIKLNMSRRTKLSIEYDAKWYPAENIPALIFDHNKILNSGLFTLQKEFLTEPLCFELLPVKFTLNQLQKIYEVILGFKLDNRNFRKKINKLEYIIPLNEKQTGVTHKPARLYIFDKDKFENNDINKVHTGFVI
jgi:8-oxo-dGTP diphosphatase